MLIGYARVSTQVQNLDLQTTALQNAGCDRFFDDKLSGTRLDRPGLERALDVLREGDTLVVWKLDRLGRSVKGLMELVGDLKKRGVHFYSVTDSCSGPRRWPQSQKRQARNSLHSRFGNL